METIDQHKNILEMLTTAIRIIERSGLGLGDIFIDYIDSMQLFTVSSKKTKGRGRYRQPAARIECLKLADRYKLHLSDNLKAV